MQETTHYIVIQYYHFSPKADDHYANVCIYGLSKEKTIDEVKEHIHEVIHNEVEEKQPELSSWSYHIVDRIDSMHRAFAIRDAIRKNLDDKYIYVNGAIFFSLKPDDNLKHLHKKDIEKLKHYWEIKNKCAQHA